MPIALPEFPRLEDEGMSDYAVSADGTLAYLPGGPARLAKRVVWVDRAGNAEPLPLPERDYEAVAISPDGRQAAVQIQDGTVGLWLYDFSRQTLTPFATTGGSSQAPIWTADGSHILYRGTRAGHRNVYWKAADGTAPEERLTTREDSIQTPTSVSPDGRWVVFTDGLPAQTDSTVWIVGTGGDRQPRQLLQPGELNGHVSPDGRWIAFQSLASGRGEIYVQPFPGPGPRRQVSVGGGDWPLWSRDGRELYYSTPDKLMVVEVTSGATFVAGPPRVLFTGRYRGTVNGNTPYDVTADGRRFLRVRQAQPQRAVTHIDVVLNWFARAPANRGGEMTIAPGTRLGPYEISAKLGEGGMGEVWRAIDTRLGREVALKVLPAAFADDAERLARFEREAQVLASLNHPNIATLYGLEHLDGQHVLVMELVEGERPRRSGSRAAPIPVDEAIPIARQIAEALEAAHDKGIVHRDLKPANVKVTPDGTVKVLDFGLAKALDPALSSAAVNPAHSPTMTDAATQAGLILGTAAYMAPEQARGAAVDKRADIWAFGVVLFEMLTGRRLFAGRDRLGHARRRAAPGDRLARPARRHPARRPPPARPLPRPRPQRPPPRHRRRPPRPRRAVGRPRVRPVAAGRSRPTAARLSAPPSSPARGWCSPRRGWSARAGAAAASPVAQRHVPPAHHVSPAARGCRRSRRTARASSTPRRSAAHLDLFLQRVDGRNATDLTRRVRGGRPRSRLLARREADRLSLRLRRRRHLRHGGDRRVGAPRHRLRLHAVVVAGRSRGRRRHRAPGAAHRPAGDQLPVGGAPRHRREAARHRPRRDASVMVAGRPADRLLGAAPEPRRSATCGRWRPTAPRRRWPTPPR